MTDNFDLFITTSKGIIRRGSVDFIRQIPASKNPANPYAQPAGIEIFYSDRSLVLESKEAEIFLHYFGGTDISRANNEGA